MKDELKEAPALGLYIALILLAVPSFLGAVLQLFWNEFVPEFVDTWRAIGDRHG